MVKLLKYVTVSIVITAIDVGLLMLLVEVFMLHYLLAVSVSYTFALLSKFALNKFWVFNNAQGFWTEQLGRFTLVSASGLILSNIIMCGGIDKLFLFYLVVKMVSIAVVFAWTFVFHNIFSFRARTDNLRHL
jgi:putative flippase GtrA